MNPLYTVTLTVCAMLSLGVAATSLWLPSAAISADFKYPLNGILFGKADRDFLQYNCTPVTSIEIKCNFAQLRVKNKRSEKDRAKYLKQRKPSKTELAQLAAQPICADIGNMLNALKHGKPPTASDFKEFYAALRSMQDGELQDNIRLLDALAAVCQEPTPQNARKMFAEHFRRDRLTCNVSVWTFDHTFKWQDDGVWVSNQGPRGLCGIIVVSRFTKAKKTTGLFWDYTTQKIVTNKQLNSGLLPCTAFDEKRYHYTWRLKTLFKQCKYIAYSHF